MKDFLGKVHNKLYCFLSYADMRLILGYKSDDKGCARISIYIKGTSPPISNPIDILAIEACLPPLDLLLGYKRRLAHLRILCSPPEINPAAARLPPSVQTPSLHRHSPDLRALSAKNAGSRLPLPWTQPRPPSKNRAHLPLDALPHSMLFLLGQLEDGLEALPVTSQHLVSDFYPDPPRAAPTRSLNSSARTSSWKNGTRPLQTRPGTRSAPR